MNFLLDLAKQLFLASPVSPQKTMLSLKSLAVGIGVCCMPSVASAVIIAGNDATADGPGIPFSSAQPAIINFTTGTDGATTMWSLDTLNLRINGGFFTNVTATVTGLGVNVSDQLGGSAGGVRNLLFTFNDSDISTRTLTAGETYTLTIRPGSGSSANYSAGQNGNSTGNPNATFTSGNSNNPPLADISASPVVVPEPSSALLLAMGSAGLLLRRRRA